jgi:hypothetical protein
MSKSLARTAADAPEGERAPRERAAAQQMSGADSRRLVSASAAMVGMRLSALRLPFLRMILSENRTPLFGIMREPEANLFSWRRGGRQSSDA